MMRILIYEKTVFIFLGDRVCRSFESYAAIEYMLFQATQ